MTRFRRFLFTSLVMTVGLMAAVLSFNAAAQHQHIIVAGDAVKWGPAPPSLPAGAQATVLLGSPAKDGPFVIRLKFPAGFIVPPHRHSKDEVVTVISGRAARNFSVRPKYFSVV